MSPGDLRIRVLRLRIGMALVAAFQVVFAVARLATATDDQHLPLRALILGVSLACVAFTYTPWAQRFIGQATLIGCVLLQTAASWLAAAQGMTLDYTVAPTIMFFAVGAIAANTTELLVFAITGAAAPAAFTLAYGWHTTRAPLIPLLMFVAASAAGALVSWFRIRQEAR